MNRFKMMIKNKRSALRLALVICVLLLQQTSVSALSLCDSFASFSFGKKSCHCCPTTTSVHSRHGNTGMGASKSAHCKSKVKASAQLRGIGSFKQTATLTKGHPVSNLFSMPQVCCQLGNPKAETQDVLISLPILDVMESPPAVIDANNWSHPISYAKIFHQRSRPLYLFLSSFLI